MAELNLKATYSGVYESHRSRKAGTEGTTATGWEERGFKNHCEGKGCIEGNKGRGTYFKRTFYPLKTCLLWSVMKKLGQGLLSYSFHPVSWNIVL